MHISGSTPKCSATDYQRQLGNKLFQPLILGADAEDVRQAAKAVMQRPFPETVLQNGTEQRSNGWWPTFSQAASR